MKIIKPGDLSKGNKLERFECHKCGCVFECFSNEPGCTLDCQERSIFRECPTCNGWAYEQHSAGGDR